MRLLILVIGLIFGRRKRGATGADRWADLTEQARSL